MRAHWLAVVIGVVAALATTSPALALGTSEPDIVWNLQSGSGEQVSNSSTGLGNVRTFQSSGGQILQAAAFSMSGLDDPLAAAFLGRYDLGLGVCNEGEFPSCGSPHHGVDNNIRHDLVIFSFAQDIYDPLRLRVGAYGWDTDFDYYVGGNHTDFPALGSFVGMTLNDILATGSWSGKHDSNSSISSGTRNTVLCPNGPGGDLDGCTAGPSETGGFLIVLANLDQSFDSCKTSNGCDAFKIKTLVGETETRVPEPGTLLMLGTAMAGLAGVTRMRGRREEK